MEKHNLEKLKTIGDSYMCAGGIPLSNLTHSVDCVLAGLDILSFMDESRAKKISEGKPFWQLRLGIHTGPLVAGVIGTKKFTYDIWGDTVNVASRMESSGELDRINISTSTYHKIKHFFDCSHRGQVHAKNKGDVDMYLVRGIKRELSISGDCKTPNDEFYRLYQALANGIPIESVSDAYERLSA